MRADVHNKRDSFIFRRSFDLYEIMLSLLYHYQVKDTNGNRGLPLMYCPNVLNVFG